MVKSELLKEMKKYNLKRKDIEKYNITLNDIKKFKKLIKGYEKTLEALGRM